MRCAHEAADWPFLCGCDELEYDRDLCKVMACHVDVSMQILPPLYNVTLSHRRFDQVYSFTIQSH